MHWIDRRLEYSVLYAYLQTAEMAGVPSREASVAWDNFYHWELNDDYLENQMRKEGSEHTDAKPREETTCV